MFRKHLLEIGAKHHLSILNSLTHTQAFSFSLSLLQTHTLINTHTHTHKHTHTHSISHIIYLSLPYVIVFFFHSFLLLDFPLKQDLVTPIQIQTHILPHTKSMATVYKDSHFSSSIIHHQYETAGDFQQYSTFSVVVQINLFCFTYL